MARKAKNLRDLAIPAGFGPETLARVVDIDRTTVHRYWLDPDFLDRTSSATLQKLIGVIPGIQEELGGSALYRRRSQLIDRLDRLGVALDDHALDEAIEDPSIEPQYLYTALDVSACLLEGKAERAVHFLRALWGRSQSRALDIVFGTNRKYQVLENRERLVGAAKEALQEIIESRGYTFPRAVAQAHLGHQLGKLSGEMAEELPIPPLRGQRLMQAHSFLRRGMYMGVLRSGDDLDVACRYDALVNRDPVARLVETWVFPSWCGDGQSIEDFTLHSNVHLQDTAVEIISEIETYNDAYVSYLVSTFLPLALEELDPDFGGRLPQLGCALERCEERTEMKELKTSSAALAKAIAKHPSAVNNR